MVPDGFGINLVGPIRTNVGLGVIARNLARSLQRHGVPMTLLNVGLQWGGGVDIGELDASIAKSTDEVIHPVNLYVLAAPSFETVFADHPWLTAQRRLHVASLWWEASALPPRWIDKIGRVDAILAGSGFIAHVAANDLPLTPVIAAPMPIEVPESVAPDRARFGLPASAMVFAGSFDPNSDPERKNPVGTIAAFRMAFGPEVADVRLVLRVNNADTDVGQATIRAMDEAARGDPRILWVTEALEYEAVLSLVASADVFVSLHRGEGLGMGMMEAMLLGKPCVATAWSGNTSFMDYRNGCPVRYRKARVEGYAFFFKPDYLAPGTFWAEPMLDDAALWMRRLHVDPALRRRLGDAARESMRAYQAEAWGSGWIEQVAALWQAQAFLPRAPGKFSNGG